MATSAYLSQGGPGAPSSDQEEGGVMNLVNTSASQGYTLPREQVVRTFTNPAPVWPQHLTQFGVWLVCGHKMVIFFKVQPSGSVVSQFGCREGGEYFDNLSTSVARIIE